MRKLACLLLDASNVKSWVGQRQLWLEVEKAGSATRCERIRINRIVTVVVLT